MANDDFMSEVFNSVTLPQVRYLGAEDSVFEKHSEVAGAQITTTTTSSHVVVTHSHSEQHFVEKSEYFSEEDHHDNVAVGHFEHHGSESDEHESHHGHDEHPHEEDFMNQVFNRPTNDTFKVENGILESDVESRSHEQHHDDEDDHADKKDDILNHLPQKTEQHDSLIEELKKQHPRSPSESSSDSSSSSSSASSDSTLKGEINNHHYDAVLEEPPHIVVPLIAPPEPEPDYDTESHHSAAPVVITQIPFDVHQAYQAGSAPHSRASSVSSHHSHHSKASSRHEPASRNSRASSISTLVSEKQVPIVVNHTSHQPQEQHEYHDYDEHHTVGEMKNFFTSKITTESKGIYKIREYGTGQRSGTNSNRSSVSSYDDHHDSHEQDHHHDDDVHHEQIIIEDRARPVLKPPQRNIQHVPQTPGEIDRESIQKVGALQQMFGGKAAPPNYAPNTHKSAKRDSTASSVSQSTVRSEKHGREQVPAARKHTQTGTSDSRRSSVASQASVATSVTSVPDVGPRYADVGKYDSIRVVRHVRSYKQFLDIYSQKEIEEAAAAQNFSGHGKVKPEPIPRPRYSISARSSYSRVASAPVQTHRPSIRPSEKIDENSHPGKLDKSTSYHTLPDLDNYRRSLIAAIQEEEEDEDDLRRQSHRSNFSIKTEKDGQRHNPSYLQDYEDIEVDISKLKSVFEKQKGASRRSSRSSVASIQKPVHKQRRESVDSIKTIEEEPQHTNHSSLQNVNGSNGFNGVHAINNTSYGHPHAPPQRHYEVLTTVSRRYL